jgi:hypothetical protein
VLLGVAALAGCDRSDETRNDLSTTREDCLADWGNKPEDCKLSTDPAHTGRGLWLGPSYPLGFWGGGWGGGTSHSIGSSTYSSSSSGSVSRGGFGSTGSSHSSSGS